MLELSVKTIEDSHEHVLNDVQHLVVVLLDLHLHIEAGEFSQVARRVRVLSAEDRSDLKHTVHICDNSHLFVQLRRLGEVGRAIEVSDGEDVSTTLTLGGDQLGSVDLNEAVLDQGLAEEEASGRLQPENGLIGRSLNTRLIAANT